MKNRKENTISIGQLLGQTGSRFPILKLNLFERYKIVYASIVSSWSVPLLSHSSWLISLGPFLLVHSSCSIPLDPIHLIHSSWSILLNPFLFIHSSKALPPYDKIIAILCWATTLLWQSSLKHKVSGHVIHLATQVLIPQSFDMPCHAHHRTKSLLYFRSWSWRPLGGHSITMWEEVR